MANSKTPSIGKPHVAIVGAGPVGCLAAKMFGNRGWKVDMFEGRPDPRLSLPSLLSPGRSVNLAISNRGIRALLSSFSEDEILKDLLDGEALPMKGRMIHDLNEGQESQKYSVRGECINSISRPLLNATLLSLISPPPSSSSSSTSSQEPSSLSSSTSLLQQSTVTEPLTTSGIPSNSTDRNENGEENENNDITVHFSHKLLRINFSDDDDSGSSTPSELTFEVTTFEKPRRKMRNEEQILEARAESEEDGKKERKVFRADLVVGCDGSFSKVREQMGRVIRMDLHQTYIPQLYFELSIPPNPNPNPNPPNPYDEDSKFRIDKEHLHIWPRGDFMLIALPNKDGSFTCTLFASQSLISSYQSPSEIISFFKAQFPDALKLIGEQEAVKAWKDGKKSGLVSIECQPYHYSSKCVLLGDANTSMVPFYGQGVNCGLESVRVLSHFLDKFKASPKNDLEKIERLPICSNTTDLLDSTSPTKLATTPFQGRLSNALKTYEDHRTPSLKAIQWLALRNYREMSEDVVSWGYLIRKRLDGILESWFGSGRRPGEKELRLGRKKDDTGGSGSDSERWGWNSLYEMVTFRSDLSYEEALRRRKWQDDVLKNVLVVFGGSVGGVGLMAGTIGAIAVMMRRGGSSNGGVEIIRGLWSGRR